MASTAPTLVDIASERIRVLRALRGLSRRDLAATACVSERHLAQIESATGNVSIRLLGQIADALGVKAAELLTPPRSPEHETLTALVDDLTPEQCEDIEALLRGRLLAGATTHERITLIGLRGAGKTTLGKRLAKERGMPYVSTTDLIEQLAGMPVGEIHSLSGQAGYRRYERLTVEQAFDTHDAAVIEAGGSIVANTPAFKNLLNGSLVVWIETSPEEHMARVVDQGDLRPIEGHPGAMDDLLGILDERTPLYQRAHARLCTSRAAIDDSLGQLMAIVEQQEAR